MSRSKKKVKKSILTETTEMHNLLLQEISRIREKIIEEPKNHCWRRVYIRSVFSMIDSICFRLKAEILDSIKGALEKNKFSPGEISMLKEQAYEVDNKGKVTKRKIYLKSEKNFKFAFYTAAKLTKGFNLDVSGIGWKSFTDAVKIRNRVTHPKSISDFSILKKELLTVNRAFKWILATYDEYIDGRVKYLKWTKEGLTELAKEIESW